VVHELHAMRGPERRRRDTRRARAPEPARRAFPGPKRPGGDRHATVSQCYLTPAELFFGYLAEG
jgi:hypothetical protein